MGLYEPTPLEISFGFPSKYDTSVIVLAKYGEKVFTEIIDLGNDREQHGSVYAIDWSPGSIFLFLIFCSRMHICEI